MKAVRLLILLAPLAVVAACASAPQVRYYTLQTPAQAAVADRGLRVQVLPVQMPAQVDVPELVVRQGAGELARVESQQWIAPLPAEVRAALSQRLQDRLGARDVQGLPQTDDVAVQRVRVVITRFEAYADHHVDVAAGWTVGPAQAATRLGCSSQVREAVTRGYPAMVAGYQRALARIADDIAQAIESNAQACP